MNHFSVAACLCFAVASLPAQSFLQLPASANAAMELSGFDDLGLPFMSPESRVQMFFDATEVGASAFVADQLALRYDGPIPTIGAPGPFTIQRLQLRIGVTTVATPFATFAANLTQPLTTVYDGTWTFLPDTGSAAPHPWGGPSNTLLFPFSTPVPIVIPPGGWLVVDLQVEGNNMFSLGFAHAILDGATTSGGVSDGSVVAVGHGCEAAVGAPAASMTTFGIYAPGAAHHAEAANLGSGAIAIYLVGLDNTLTGGAVLPLDLPGTNCTLYTDPVYFSGVFADASGAVTGVQPATTLSIPADPVTSGVVVYEQFVSLVETANPFGWVLSNSVTVTLGSFVPLGRGTYAVTHDADANALYANDVRPFGYAMQLRTL